MFLTRLAEAAPRRVICTNTTKSCWRRTIRAKRRRNVYGLNLISRKTGGQRYTYLYNGHADVTALLDDSGTVQGSYYYDAFGNLLSQTGAVNNPIRYAGYQYDDETKLYYLNARFFDPKIARFLSEDMYSGKPSDPLSLNLYTYVSSNPILYQDPTGHWQQSDKDLNIEAQAKITALTSAYYNASSPQERKAIQAQAEAVRNSSASKAPVVTPLVFQTAQITQVVNKAVETRGYMTAQEWSNATVSAGIKTVTVSNVDVSKGSTNTNTTTTIGRTNLSVQSQNIVTSKSTMEVTSNAMAKIELSYNVTATEAKFVQSMASKDVSLEQVLVVLDTLERNSGNITKTQLKDAGLKYVSGLFGSRAGDNVSTIEMAYEISKKGMTITEAEIKYQQEVVSKNIEAAFGIMAVSMAGGGLKVSSAKEIPPACCPMLRLPLNLQHQADYLRSLQQEIMLEVV